SPLLGMGLGADVYFGNGATAATNFGHVRASRVKVSTEMIAIMDRERARTATRYRYNVEPTKPDEYRGTVHRSGANVLFVDGHVGWFLQADLTNTATTST